MLDKNEFREAYEFLTKTKKLQPLKNEYEQKVIEKAKLVSEEIENLREEVVKSFPESKDVKCTVLERQIVEAMGKYIKACQLSDVARFDYLVGSISDDTFIAFECHASNLLDKAIELSKELLKERFVIVI